MKIDDTAAIWDREKDSLGAASRPQKLPQAANLGPLKSMENVRDRVKSLEIYENQCKCMKS